MTLGVRVLKGAMRVATTFVMLSMVISSSIIIFINPVQVSAAAVNDN